MAGEGAFDAFSMPVTKLRWETLQARDEEVSVGEAIWCETNFYRDPRRELS